MLRQIKRWLRGARSHTGEDKDLDEGFQNAMHDHLVSTRLVRIQAARSAKALKRLSEVLAMRAQAIDSIQAAEDALKLLDEVRRDDDK